MEFYDIDVKILNFNVSDFTKIYLNSMMRELLEQAPDGAKLTASFTQNQGFYKGVVRIQSQVGPFFGIATADTIEAVAQKLLDQMNTRLLKWKEKRFMKNREGQNHGTKLA